MRSGWVAIGFCFLGLLSQGQTVCRVAVATTVEVAGPAVTLADLFDPGSCPELLQAAARIRLGRVPLAGSPRVLEGNAVRGLVERAAGKVEADRLTLAIPERVTIRRGKDSGGEMVSTARGLESSRLRRGVRNADDPSTVRVGQRAILLWDQQGIRLRVSAICLDAGREGETVRARVGSAGRVVRAVVEGVGKLRATS